MLNLICNVHYPLEAKSEENDVEDDDEMFLHFNILSVGIVACPWQQRSS